MSAFIHPSSVIESSVTLGENVRIGPFCHLKGDVVLGDDVQLISHVSLAGKTTIGKGTVIYPFSSLGHRPQDLKYKGEASTLTIGAYNMIREYVTMQPGTEGGIMKTVVGDHCLFMASSHVAHDCIIGNHVILANNATLGGHVCIEDYAIIGGLAAIHQFVRIGKHAIVGGMSGVEHDVLPYASVKGDRASLSGLNLVGLRRRGASREEITALKEAYDYIFSGQETLGERIEKLASTPSSGRVADVVNFIRQDSKKKLCMPKAILNENI
jgi:UDP-N-acetylglucosamine acyltransferase